MKNNILVQYSDFLMSLNIEEEEKIILWVKASEAYYLDEPILSDELFDNLTDEIKELSNKYPFISEIINTKIQTVDGLVNVNEVVSQMISLFKIKYVGLMSVTEIHKFLNPNRNPDIDSLLFYGPKFDGMAIKHSIQTNNKKLTITRGGQDVTSMLINHKDIRKITRPITHGELVIKKSVFQEKYSEEYENPRNCIMGVLKQNPDDLDFIECTDGISPLNLNQGFLPVWNLYNKSINLESHYFDLKQKSEYQIDGIVIGYASKTQEIKDNYPLNLVAVKFKSASARTIVVDIEWTQKKSGNLTPIILIQPVKLDGSTITKVAGLSKS